MAEVNDLYEIDDYIEGVADLFRILGDETRTKILSILEKGEENVTSIANKANMTISAVSHQLRILRQAKLIKPRKDGKEVYYYLDDEHVVSIFKCALEHVKE